MPPQRLSELATGDIPTFMVAQQSPSRVSTPSDIDNRFEFGIIDRIDPAFFWDIRRRNLRESVFRSSQELIQLLKIVRYNFLIHYLYISSHQNLGSEQDKVFAAL